MFSFTHSRVVLNLYEFGLIVKTVIGKIMYWILKLSKGILKHVYDHLDTRVF